MNCDIVADIDHMYRIVHSSMNYVYLSHLSGLTWYKNFIDAFAVVGLMRGRSSLNLWKYKLIYGYNICNHDFTLFFNQSFLQFFTWENASCCKILSNKPNFSKVVHRSGIMTSLAFSDLLRMLVTCLDWPAHRGLPLNSSLKSVSGRSQFGRKKTPRVLSVLHFYGHQVF